MFATRLRATGAALRMTSPSGLAADLLHEADHVRRRRLGLFNGKQVRRARHVDQCRPLAQFFFSTAPFSGGAI